MKKSMRKFSVLGLVLTAAAAITAAIVPSSAKSDGKVEANGTLQTISNDGGVELKTCVTNVTPGVSCHITASAATTAGTAANSFAAGNVQTGNNTTLVNDIAD